jgi:hypothetical protein
VYSHESHGLQVIPCAATVSIPTKKVTVLQLHAGPSSQTSSQFMSLCHPSLCRADFDPNFDFTCGCGVKCCRLCSGLPKNWAKSKLDFWAKSKLEACTYACDQCRPNLVEKNPEMQRLNPRLSMHICCQCRYPLSSQFYCEIPALCSICTRGFCQECAAVVDFDAKKRPLQAKFRITGRLGATIECVYCVGRAAFASGRRAALYHLIRQSFEKAPPRVST